MVEVLKGNLSQINLINLLSLLSKAKHSGRLFLKTDKEEGAVFFKRGEIYAANFGEKKGYEALLKLTALTQGNFSFQDELTTSERHFDEPTESILEKINTQLQSAISARALQNKVLSLIPKPAYWRDKKEEVSLQPQEWMVIALSQKQLSLSKIASQIKMDINEVVKIANKLQKQGLAKLQDKEEIRPPEKQQKYIPLLFWKTLKAELASLIGPIAEAVIEDEIESLGEIKERFPYDKISILIERISEEIDDPNKKIIFQKKMLEILKRI